MRPARRAAMVAATLAVAATSAGLAGCSSGAHPHQTAPRATPLGSYPSYLPKDSLGGGTDSVLTGTTARPALTSQGDAVRVRTGHWSVLITVTGPQVPAEGLPVQVNADTCTWTVTMSGATGAVPVKTADFTAIDQQGHVYKPRFVVGQPKPPSELQPGRKVKFELRAVEATGEGLMRWAPDGTHIVAKWDFVVEND